LIGYFRFGSGDLGGDLDLDFSVGSPLGDLCLGLTGEIDALSSVAVCSLLDVRRGALGRFLLFSSFSGLGASPSDCSSSE
jgi:hypothetical protein